MSQHTTFPPNLPTPCFLERQQHLPFSCLSKSYVSLEQGEDILAQGQRKQDLSFAWHSPKCVNTWSDQQRGILPGYGHREIKAATLLNRISYLFVWHLIVLNKGQCVLTVFLFLSGKSYGSSPQLQDITLLFYTQVFSTIFYEPTP